LPAEVKPVRIGYVTPNSWGLPHLTDVVDLAVRAEEAGADSLWVSHHVLHVGFVAQRLGQGAYFDPLISLAAIAGATSRARVGTSVLVIPYLHPMTTAKALATIDDLSTGRLDVGVGVGGLREENDTIGQVPFRQRGRYADEFIDVLHALWTPGPSSYAGEWFAFDDLEAYPGASGSTIPILIGGHDDAALRRAATRGDGWHGIGVDPPGADALRTRLASFLADTGRPEEGFPVQVRLHIDVEDIDVDAWRKRVSAYGDVGVTDLVLAPQSGDPELHRRWIDTLLPAISSP
jgi:probable F420-dependent oxidoreductase